MEAKVYARSVNKSGVAMQVIDGIFSEGVFTAHQLADLTRNDIIVMCDKCGKHRLLSETQDPPDESAPWFCEMNHDKKFNSCNIPEAKTIQGVPRQDTMHSSRQDDAILQHVMGVVNTTTRKDPLVSSAFPVETTGGADVCCEEAIANLRNEISQEKAKRSALVLAAKRKIAEKTGRNNVDGGLTKQHALLDTSHDDDEVEIVGVRPAKVAKRT
jgi:hypothetical protein